MERVMITGASRGIGLELSRQLAARGDRVFATCRNPGTAGDLQELAAAYPEQVAVLALDVTDQASIEAAVAEVEAQADGLDVLINNAGIFPRGERPGNLQAETILTTMQVNAVGPLMVAQRALDLLRRGSSPRVINITSQLGSLSRRASGRCYAYCSSKAALNMLTRSLAFDLQPEGIVVVAVHPGWVRTDMGGDHAPVLPGESARGIMGLMDNLTAEQTSKFLTWDGREHSW